MTDAERMAITKYDLFYEQRMTKVETALEGLKEDMSDIKIEFRAMRSDFNADIKWMLGIVGSVGLILAGLMAHGFKWF